MRPFALAALISSILLFASSADAQTRSAGPVPILVDVIGAGADSSAFARPSRSRSSHGAFAAAATSDLERRVFDMLNDVRAEKGMSPLVWSDELAELARVHSQSMAGNKFFSHRDLEGLTVDGRAESYGITGWRGIGENIATLQGYSDPAPVAVEKWLQSPGHRQNILGGRWSDSAIGIAVTGDGTYYFTQVFLLR